MDTLLGLISAISGLFAVGSIVKIILLVMQMAANPEEKHTCQNAVKNVLVVLVLSILVSGGAVSGILSNYFV